MDLKAVALATFIKRCPHCESCVSMRRLHRVPHKSMPLRWYQVTPAPHAACPKCGGFVRSSMENSPWLLAILFLLVAGAASAITWPGIRAFTSSVSGGVVICTVVLVLAWIGHFKSKLVPEPPQH